jgi:hypothetical protein
MRVAHRKHVPGAPSVPCSPSTAIFTGRGVHASHTSSTSFASGVSLIGSISLSGSRAFFSSFLSLRVNDWISMCRVGVAAAVANAARVRGGRGARGICCGGAPATRGQKEGTKEGPGGGGGGAGGGPRCGYSSLLHECRRGIKISQLACSAL